ncbi:hypothetical protein AHIS1636_40220 [Arthrobacter mangrovi]|uniref:Uncharacterized protein n=1 Tax=Arthrobacter mangrovi TaxID=2966350 RepID=A0ABQ5N022_9MICC|nr:hypothetical protein AHIS1636_40220 [Arthrobacter mangrovi]
MQARYGQFPEEVHTVQPRLYSDDTFAPGEIAERLPPAEEILTCLPVDPALARTVAEHVHCGEPMETITASALPITAPLQVLMPGILPPEPAETTTPGFRCKCGFTIDAPALT